MTRGAVNCREITHAEVIQTLRQDIGALSLRAYARKRGFSVAFISDVLRGRRDATERLLRPLGIVVEKKTLRAYWRVQGEK